MEAPQMAEALETLVWSFPSNRWTGKVLQTWGAMLIDLDQESLFWAIRETAQTEESFPTIAGLRKRALGFARKREAERLLAEQAMEDQARELSKLPTTSPAEAAARAREMIERLGSLRAIEPIDPEDRAEAAKSSETRHQLRARIEAWNKDHETEGSKP